MFNRTTFTPDDHSRSKLETAIKTAYVTCSPQIQATLYIDFKYSVEVQLGLAENPQTNQIILCAIAETTTYTTIKEAVITNPNAPTHLLIHFAEGKNVALQDLALDTIIRRTLDEAELL